MKRVESRDAVIATNTPQYEKARKVLPGGVNSSVRLSTALGVPFYVSKAQGSRIFDMDDNEYVDMCTAHGAALLGHKHPSIDEAMSLAAEMGYASVFETPYHEELARKVCEKVPCADMVRFCSSGSEATLHLIRGCRGATGKSKIIRVEGHFHGYHEMIYIGGQPPKAEWPENRRTPFIESPGIPAEFRDLIIPIPFNDPEALEAAVREHAHETALLILEPVNYNTGCIKPDPGYLELARKLTAENGIILFFDEVQSAFKKSMGGAQQDFGVVPDVAAIGKSLGGGFPLSGFCGRREIMEHFKPVGTVQHSGTFNAHLVPVLAGLAFQKELEKPGFYPTLQRLENRFHTGMDRIIAENSLNMVVPHHGARFNVILGRRDPARRYEETFCHDYSLMCEIWAECYQRGVYFHDYGGSPVHHGYSIQHTEEDIDLVLNALEEVLRTKKDKLEVIGRD